MGTVAGRLTTLERKTKAMFKPEAWRQQILAVIKTDENGPPLYLDILEPGQAYDEQQFREIAEDVMKLVIIPGEFDNI